MKKYITAKPIPFIPVGTEFEHIARFYFISTIPKDNTLTFSPEEMLQLEAEGWVEEVDNSFDNMMGDPLKQVDDLLTQAKETLRKFHEENE